MSNYFFNQTFHPTFTKKKKKLEKSNFISFGEFLIRIIKVPAGRKEPRGRISNFIIILPRRTNSHETNYIFEANKNEPEMKSEKVVISPGQNEKYRITFQIFRKCAFSIWKFMRKIVFSFFHLDEIIADVPCTFWFWLLFYTLLFSCFQTCEIYGKIIFLSPSLWL